MEIRQITPRDLQAVMDLKESVGWNQTQWDWMQFLRNPELCLLAWVDEKIVGTTTAYSYKSKVAWIGMVIVHENYRRKGISKQLLLEIISRLQATHQTIKLDATALGKPVYEKFGFKAEQLIFRMIKPGSRSIPKPIIGNSPQSEQILTKDQVIMEYDRSDLLKALSTTYPGFVCISEENDDINFLLGRNGSKFTQLGPLIANNGSNAIELIKLGMRKIGEGGIIVDVMGDKSTFIERLNALGFSKQREFVRMFTGSPILGKQGNQYLIIGPEFG